MGIKTKYIRFLAAIYYGLYKANYCFGEIIKTIFKTVYNIIAKLFFGPRIKKYIHRIYGDAETWELDQNKENASWSNYFASIILMGVMIGVILNLVSLCFALFGLRCFLNPIITIIMAIFWIGFNVLFFRTMYSEDFFRKCIPVYDKIPQRKRIFLISGSVILILFLFVGSMILICYFFSMADYFRKLWGWNI